MPYRIVACLDAAYGQSSRADYSAICVGALDTDPPPPKRLGDIHLLEAWRGRVPLQDLPREVERMYRRWGPEYVGIENTLWQSALIETMRRLGTVPFREIDRRKARNPDKKTRAGKLAFHYSEGRIFHPTRTDANSAWLDAFEDELLSFTGEPGRDEHDDFVDSWVDVVDSLTLVNAYGDTQPIYHGFSFDAGMTPEQADRRAAFFGPQVRQVFQPMEVA